MDRMIARFFFENWQQKLMALFAAIAVWVFVNQSIIATKTIPNIPIRIANLPEDQTIRGLLPNGIMDRRMTLTLSGSKDVIEELEPGDLEVLLDVSTNEGDDWIVNVTKKNLVSLNPSIDLAHHITQVSHSEFLIKLSELVTAEIPVIVLALSEEAPPGYEFLDVWPQRLTQTISGPAEAVERLKAKGLELILDLKKISKKDLDAINSSPSGSSKDEISFIVPNQWKKVVIPFHRYDEELINDPEAQFLRIDFFRKQLLPFNETVPVRVFYPVQFLPTINPITYPLSQGGVIKEKSGINFIDYPLYARNVGRHFLDVIKDHVEVVILASPRAEREYLHWNVEIHDPHQLENNYIALLSSQSNETSESLSEEREELLRKRFRTYARRFRFYTGNDKKFRLKSTLNQNQIIVEATRRGLS